MTVEIKRLETHETDRFLGLVRLFEEVFEMEDFTLPSPGYLQKLLEREELVVFVALSEGSVIGGLTAYILQRYYSENPLAYIYDLAVKAEFQRQGIGKQLVSAIMVYGQEVGWEEIFVQADNADQHALNFYRATGGNAEEVVHFTYSLPAGRVTGK